MEHVQGSKPWRYTGTEEHMEREDIKMLVKKWWDIYNDESLDYKKKKTPVTSSDPVNLLTVALSGSAKALAAPAAESKRAISYLMAPPAA